MVAPELPEDVLATFQGLDHCAFYLRDIVTVAEYAIDTGDGMQMEDSMALNEADELRCPNCWETFSPADKNYASLYFRL